MSRPCSPRWLTTLRGTRQRACPTAAFTGVATRWRETSSARCQPTSPTFAVTPIELIPSGDTVAVVARYTGTGKSTGKELDLEVAHVWDVRDGKVARFRHFPDTVGSSSRSCRPRWLYNLIEGTQAAGLDDRCPLLGWRLWTRYRRYSWRAPVSAHSRDPPVLTDRVYASRVSRDRIIHVSPPPPERPGLPFEMVAVVPFLILAALAAWQIALAGHALWLTAGAARAAARAETE